MRARSVTERGSAMVLAIMVTLLMLALVLGTFALVEGQQQASADERIRDSSFNLSDAAVESVVTYMNLANRFPAKSLAPAGSDYPYGDANGNCGAAPGAGDNCPDPGLVLSAFSVAGGHPDYGTTPTWTTSVLDNNQPTKSFYKEDGAVTGRTGRHTSTGAVLRYDSNDDGKVWVRAESVARGRKRVLVALAERRTTAGPAPYPQTGIFAEDFGVPYATVGLFLDMQGNSTGAPGRVEVSCNNPAAPSHSQAVPACPQADATKGQIVPWTMSTTQNSNICTYEDSSVMGNPTTGPFCWEQDSGAKVVELRARAVAAGTYYNGTCPTAAQLSGPIVFIDGAITCSYTGTNTFNSAANPGLVVLGKFGYGASCNSATGGVCLNLGGTTTFYGMIYDGNSLPRGPFMWGVGITGGAKYYGVIIAEAFSKVAVASTQRPAFVYDPKAYEDYGSTPPPGSSSTEVKITPGTFHEIPTT